MSLSVGSSDSTDSAKTDDDEKEDDKAIAVDAAAAAAAAASTTATATPPPPPLDWSRLAEERYIFSYGRALEPKYSNPSIAGYYRPWRFIDKKRSGVSRVFYARSREFRIALDVSQFSYENVAVKLVGEHIVIEAHHATAVDYLGRISRHLVRKYKTPPDLKLNTITAKHKRGFLILYADRDFQPAEKPALRVTDSAANVADDRDGSDGSELEGALIGGGTSSVDQLKDVASTKDDLQEALGIGGGSGGGGSGGGGSGGGGGALGSRCGGTAADPSRAQVGQPPTAAGHNDAEVVIRVRKSSSPSLAGSPM